MHILDKSDISITELAEMVGYENVNTFYASLRKKWMCRLCSTGNVGSRQWKECIPEKCFREKRGVRKIGKFKRVFELL